MRGWKGLLLQSSFCKRKNTGLVWKLYRSQKTVDVWHSLILYYTIGPVIADSYVNGFNGFNGNGFLKGIEDPLESWACVPFRLLGKLASIKKTALPKVRDNPILIRSIKIWHDMHRFVGRKGAFSYLTPRMGNRDFLPGVDNVVLCSWRERGVRLVGDLFNDNNFLI